MPNIILMTAKGPSVQMIKDGLKNIYITVDLDSECNRVLQCSHPKRLHDTPAHNVTSLLIKSNSQPLYNTVSCKNKSDLFVESSVCLFLSEPLAVKSDTEVNHRVNSPTPPFFS